MGSKVCKEPEIIYYLGMTRMLDRCVHFSDSEAPVNYTHIIRTAKYTEKEILDALGMTSQEMFDVLGSPDKRAGFYKKLVPKHALEDRVVRNYETILMWLLALAKCLDNEHEVVSMDDPLILYLGFKDQVTGLWHRIGISNVKENGRWMPDVVINLLQSVEGRQKLVTEGLV